MNPSRASASQARPRFLHGRSHDCFTREPLRLGVLATIT